METHTGDWTTGFSGRSVEPGRPTEPPERPPELTPLEREEGRGPERRPDILTHPPARPVQERTFDPAPRPQREPLPPPRPVVPPFRPVEQQTEPVHLVHIMEQHPVREIHIVHSVVPEVPHEASAPKPEVGRSRHPFILPRLPEEKSLTPVNEKELTLVKHPENEKINENLTPPPQDDNFSLIFSPAPTANKLPKKMQFKGKKGRQRTEAEVIDLLTFVQSRNGVWPHDNYVSDQMRRYYRREYPEYFRKVRKHKKVQSHGPAPIDLQSRRTGTNV